LLKNVNLGLIGLGTRGKTLLDGCLRLENANLVAVADVSKKALRFARDIGVKNVQVDYNKLLNDQTIDAVVISLPNFLHYECAKRAAEAGKDILLEKPLARNLMEGEQILSYVKREGVKLMLGYGLRFSEPFTRLKDQIQNGELGEVQIASATNISTGPFSPRTAISEPAPVPAWWFDKELTGGGALLDLGSHIINILRWYLGEVDSVKSYLGYRFNLGFEDSAVVFLKFKNDAIATVNVGWFSKDYRVSVELYGTVKGVYAANSHPGFLDFASDAIKSRFGKIKRSLVNTCKELQYFVDCVNSDVNPYPSGEEGLLDLKIISLAYNNTFPLGS
jgi:predicted dehydrogenase